MKIRLVGIAALVAALLFSPDAPAASRVQGLPGNLEGDPEAQGFADLLFANGMVAMADRDWGAAHDTFNLAAEAYPADATYAYFAGVSLTRLGRPAEAAEAIGRTLPPAPNRAPESRVRFDLGEAHYLKGDLAAAQKELEQSIRLDGKDGWAPPVDLLLHELRLILQRAALEVEEARPPAARAARVRVGLVDRVAL